MGEQLPIDPLIVCSLSMLPYFLDMTIFTASFAHVPSLLAAYATSVAYEECG